MYILQAGHIYFDTFPLNENPVKEAEYNIRQFKRMWSRVEQLDAAGMHSLLVSHDVLGTLELMEQQ